VGEPGRLVERQIQELTRDQLVEPAVFAERERVIEARDEQDVLHPERHQALERLIRVGHVEGEEFRLGHARVRLAVWPSGR
jgi:hypothetical protein